MADENAVDTVTTPAPTTPIQPAPAQGKTFSEDYVASLREEAKTNRIAKKNLEARVKALIGLKDDEEIDDAKINAYQANLTKAQSEATAKANARLLTAEIKQLEGYDSKLIERLLDKSKVTITEDGEVAGLKEAVEALEVEFPLIKKSGVPNSPANPPASTVTEIEQAESDYAKAVKSGDTVTAIMLKNKIFSMKK